MRSLEFAAVSDSHQVPAAPLPPATANPRPAVIQGGMGVSISDWHLARQVSLAGQLGFVSGTAINVVLARRLQEGDPDGSCRRALAAFPIPGVADRIIDRYFVEGGIAEGKPYKAVPAFSIAPRRPLLELTVAANFVEIFLAKEGHSGPVGVNYLHKVKMPHPPSLYGAVLAGVDYVAMGAGIPRDIPGMLDTLVAHDTVVMPIEVDNAERGKHAVTFDPAELWDGATPPELHRPKFLAIIASTTLANALAREPATRPDGFVIEGPIAGGHNAPPRGKTQLDELGQPVYGARDVVDLDAVAGYGIPFWLAGGFGRPGGVSEAQELGAEGVQIGTAFAMSRDSGMTEDMRAKMLAAADAGQDIIRTDAIASPTGFPFKVAQLDGTLADDDTYETRGRICDLGFLVTPFEKEDGRVAYRCPSEPVEDYVKKGGDIRETEGRQCLCNGLMATTGLGQRRAGDVEEPPIVTSGDSLAFVADLARAGGGTYGALDVLEAVLPSHAAVKTTQAP